ncbi:hypothetical protein C491_04420 [Natronococcus amylolyticus DSM 10524]|uniref:Profilin fold domain-containing protein n=1 Tax=Natronococcus amylolyticus DSM 10524 TaxID=1227497 RepID=L9XFZ2_9EURY|nr:hypothetical protein [Natronococcus amylolyticus]ELY60512.1 hypothetical protein C491_04420 [Natronococcus amylolyticus DSM 10524]
MTDGLDSDVASADDVAKRRDDVAARVRTHAGEMARELAVLQGGDYGQRTFETDDGDWTLKYEAGDVQYLRYEPSSGSEIYVVSSKQPPEPGPFERALEDYDAFVEVFNDHIESFEGLFDDAATELPAVASAAELAAERDRILERIREVATAMAQQLHRYDGEYGTYRTTVSGTRWELKWDGDAVSYLRVGGSDGTYLLSQYGPAPAPEVRRLVGDVGAFVSSFNEDVADLEADLSRVSFETTT